MMCGTCGIWLNGEDALLEHVRSKRHKDGISKQDCKNPMFLGGPYPEARFTYTQRWYLRS